MNTERTDLGTHVDLCTERYKQLEYRLGQVENKITDINVDLQDFKTEVRKNFDDIKTMLGQARDERFKSTVTAAASVIVGLLGLIGYIVIHLPK